jgi:hypothetical protein
MGECGHEWVNVSKHCKALFSCHCLGKRCINASHLPFTLQVALGSSGGDRQPTLEELQGENLLQTLPPASSSREGRWSKHRLQGLLPQPAPEEEPQPFILDLRNFPDLANADLGAQNPNIQVRVTWDLGLPGVSHVERVPLRLSP